MNDPWNFGWTQILTLIGFVITIIIATCGFRTFDRWRREKIEEKKIDVAIGALALAYESKFVFAYIRSRISYSTDWLDMPEIKGEQQNERNLRGAFFAILKRINSSKEFFDRAWKLQVLCNAIFGAAADDLFLKLHEARVKVEVSAEMLMDAVSAEDTTEESRKSREEWRSDVWQSYRKGSGVPDRVEENLTEFRTRVDTLCRPVIDRKFGKGRKHQLFR